MRADRGGRRARGLGARAPRSDAAEAMMLAPHSLALFKEIEDSPYRCHRAE